MCTKDLTSLASISLIQMDQGSKELKPLGKCQVSCCANTHIVRQPRRFIQVKSAGTTDPIGRWDGPWASQNGLLPGLSCGLPAKITQFVTSLPEVPFVTMYREVHMTPSHKTCPLSFLRASFVIFFLELD